MKGCRPLERNEVEMLRSCFKGRMAIRNKALFFLGINTGFRVSELLSIKIDDVLDDNGQFKDRLQIGKRFMKGQKSSRSVLFNDPAKEALEPWVKVLKRKGHTHANDFICTDMCVFF